MSQRGMPVGKSFQKKQSWIAPSFGDFGDLDDGPPRPKKTGSRSGACEEGKPVKRRKQEDLDYASFAPTLSRGKNKAVNTTSLWVDKYTPTTKDDLAVHKKKVGEVEGWLQISLKSTSRKNCSLLLLTGPAGIGKTATVRVLARDMKLDLHEWSNPVVDGSLQWDENANRPEFAPIGGITSESQAVQFRDFLLRANRYSSLQLTTDTVHNKAILVEEFPNVFFRDTSQFHNILRDYVRQGGSPLIFILSDSAGGDSNERLLFPKDIQAELNMANISFNPVAPTLMSKVLQRIVSTENLTGVKKGSATKSSLEGIVTASSGDIRAAINALQFSYRRSGSGGSKSKRKAPTSKLFAKLQSSGGGDRVDQTVIGGRDNSLFLFRALGKILYCKRDAAAGQVPVPPLPSHLSHHERLPLLVDPEDVVERAQVSGPFFISFLHQNYLEFYQQVEDVVQASDYFSDADHLTIDWANRSVLQQYAASVATRGLMHSNTARTSSTGTGKSGLGWKPLHKPQMFATQRKVKDNHHLGKCLFRGKCWTPEDLMTQLLPFMAIIKTRLQDPGQFHFLQELCHFARTKNSRAFSERLEEKDVTEGGSQEVSEMDMAEKSDVRSAGSSQATDAVTEEADTTMQTAVLDQDEDILIEDFDDDL